MLIAAAAVAHGAAGAGGGVLPAKVELEMFAVPPMLWKRIRARR